MCSASLDRGQELFVLVIAGCINMAMLYIMVSCKVKQIIQSILFQLRKMIKTTTTGCRYGLIVLLVAVLLLTVEVSALTASPVIAPTNKYINISSYVFNTAAYYGTATTNLNPFTYPNTFTFAQAGTSYHTGVSVAQLNYQFPNSRALNYSLDVGTKTTTGVPILFYTNNANKISLLVIYILIIQSGFNDYSFWYFTYDIKSTFTQGMSNTKNWGISPTFSKTSTSIYSSIIGLDLMADPTFEVGFSTKVVLSTSSSCDVTITSLSSKNTKLNSFTVLAFFYNPTSLLALSPASRYTSSSLSGTGGSNALLIAADTKNIVRNYNVMLGMCSFWIKGQNWLNFVTMANPSVSVTGNSNNTWLQFGFQYIIFEFFYCPDGTPYLMVATTTCYDICPMRYCSNNGNFQCTACPTYDCYYCGINGKCTTCNDTLDFRYLDNTTMRCLPLPGYYNAGVSQAAPCVAANCLTCTSTTYCLSCALGKYLVTSTHTCATCMANCLNCTSGTTCLQCSPYYVFSVSACVPNCSNITYCTTCTVSFGIVCSACSTGYSLVNNVCQEVCGDSMMVTPEQCDDGNTDPNDGCSSTCQIEVQHYCDITATPSQCGNCVSNCDNCTNAIACTVCSTGYALSSGLCVLDCSVIANCSACSYDAIIKTVCTACYTGYTVAANNTCASQCGDGIRVTPQGCDDHNTAPNDGCSATCTVQIGYYCTDTYPTASTCGQCINFCSVCSSATSCTTCSTDYTYNSSLVACTIDCSVVANCSACDFNGATRCTACVTGYHLNSNNTCDTLCGDGYRNGNEVCDDNNTNSTDGCSSTCALQTSFYCVDAVITGGVQSNCSACIPFCTSCKNATSCDACSTYYSYSVTNISCNIDCSNITYCTTCNFTGVVNCQICSKGYYVSSNICASQCGDGILVTQQNCDDGNTNNNDGCSSACKIETGFLCSNATANGSALTSCSPCLLHCTDCTGNINDCVTCDTGYLYSNSGPTIICDVDCATFLDCAACSFSQCTSCNPGYTMDSSNNCKPTCGDGKLMLGQICDDGNKVNGDGCSSTCQVESNFECTVIDVASVCSLLSCSIDLVSINKVAAANSVIIQYQVNPFTLPAFNTLNWADVVFQQSNLSLTFSSISFDNSSGQLSINADYMQDLNYELLQIGFRFPPIAPFNILNSTNASTILLSDNNLSLDAYSSDTYSNAKILQYCALGASALALLLFILGYFSGKLIGLECITVFQLTFLSLLTFDNLSPSFASLSLLSYSCGYNLKNMQSSQINLGRRFRAVNFSEPFLQNYNLTIVLFILPLILSLILAIINRVRYRSSNATLIKYSQLFRGQFCFYGLMFSAYNIVLSLGIQISHLGSGFTGIAAGGLLTLVIVAYAVLMHKKPAIFGEFTQKFNNQSCIQSHYYTFLIFERAITTGCLLMMFFSPQGAIIVALLALQIVLVLYKQPYKGERAWLRPFLNLLISALIQIIFILDPMLSKSMRIYAVYAPFAVIGLLVVTLVYNIYYFIRNLRGEPLPENLVEEDEDNFMKNEFNKLDLFQQKIMKSPKLNMLDKSSPLESPERPDSPSKFSSELLNSVRDKLNKVKLTAVDVTNISMQAADVTFGDEGEL